MTQTPAVIRFPCASYLFLRLLCSIQRHVSVFCRSHGGGEERGEEGEAAGSCESNESETPKLRGVFAGTGRTWAQRERGGLGGCAGCGRIAARRVTAS